MKRIVLAGGSGFIGRALGDHLRRHGYDLIVLTRGEAKSADGVTYVHWDGRTVGDWARYLDGAEAVVNLAGRNVNCRYNAKNREEIRRSRIDAVQAVGEAIAACTTPPRVLIQSSTTAMYIQTDDAILDESARPASGFSPDTAVMWEEAFNSVPTPRTRRVLLRISFVLGRSGGALRTLERLTRWFMGGRAGSGRQWISWVHIKDLCRIVRFAIEREDVQGLYHATAPNPVTNAQFMRELRRALRRPWSPPVPRLAVRFGSWVMRTEAELARRGRRCIPRRLMDLGFEFHFPHLPLALADLYGQTVSGTSNPGR
jgi:uncharacterized protein (TIGR01777 family)